jgi:hypothetical protein
MDLLQQIHTFLQRTLLRITIDKYYITNEQRNERGTYQTVEHSHIAHCVFLSPSKYKLRCNKNTCKSIILLGACGSAVVKALCYKPESRGFNTR